MIWSLCLQEIRVLLELRRKYEWKISNLIFQEWNVYYKVKNVTIFEICWEAVMESYYLEDRWSWEDIIKVD